MLLGSYCTAKEVDPLKQGLKQFKEGKHEYTKQAKEVDPLKQGLKLFSIFPRPIFAYS